jgi:hypothetical protein
MTSSKNLAVNTNIVRMLHLTTNPATYASCSASLTISLRRLRGEIAVRDNDDNEYTPSTEAVRFSAMCSAPDDGQQEEP